MSPVEQQESVLQPKFSVDTTAWAVLTDCVRRLADLDNRGNEEINPTVRVKQNSLWSVHDAGEWMQHLRACIAVLCDLKVQGWHFEVGRPGEIIGA